MKVDLIAHTLLFTMMRGCRCGRHVRGDAGLHEFNFALPRDSRVVDTVDHIRRLHGAGGNIHEHMVRDTVEVDAGHARNGLQDIVHLNFLGDAAGSAEHQGKSFFGGWVC